MQKFIAVFLQLLLAVHSQPLPGDIIVAKDDSGDFTTIQAALSSTPNGSLVPMRIYIKSGIYFEKIVIPFEKTNIHFIGENKAESTISYDDYSGKPSPDGGNITTGTSYTILVRGNNFYAQDITFLNSAGPDVAQAVALHVVADRVIFNNCNIIANQDTLYPTTAENRQSRQYYKDCYIEGTTDFIFGAATALFENCTIMSLKNSYITAASTPEENEYGFVFKNCTLLANDDATRVYLGRPWRPWARTVFLETVMDNHILPSGWHNWDNPDNEKTAFYAEYLTQGVDVTQRVSWSKQLTHEEAEEYTLENIFNGEDGPWFPSISDMSDVCMLSHMTRLFLVVFVTLRIFSIL